jgi:hypothetical protein
MSHVEEVTIDCRDLDALDVAAQKCGGELVRGQRTHAWWGTWLNDWRDAERSAVARGVDPATFGQCDHAIRIKGRPGRNGAQGPWEIGVVARADGFALIYDNYGGAGRELENAFGKDLMRLKNEAASEVAMRELLRDGWRIMRTTTPSGEIVLQADR